MGTLVGNLLRLDAVALAAADAGMVLLAEVCDAEPIESSQLSRDVLVIVAAWFDEHPDAADEVAALIELIPCESP